MKKVNIFNIKHIHFVGIGGISMSGLATFMKYLGYIVSGSDINSSDITQRLLKKGVEVYIGHNKDNVKDSVDLVVYTGAVNHLNEELHYAIKNDISTMERKEFLGLICPLFNKVIAVAGTHGKTTTTALIGEMFITAGLNPTIHVGGKVNSSYNNFRVGGTTYFITEACEYNKSLEFIKSDVGVITNIEKDHMDCYKDIYDIYKTFNKFAYSADNKIIIYNHKNVKSNIRHDNIVVCGVNDSDYVAFNIKKYKDNKYCFEVKHKGINIGYYELNIDGKYNVENALLAIAVAKEYDIKYKDIYKALKNFKGIKRRNEYLMDYKAKKVIADYGHHPTEVISSIKNYKELYKDVCVVFQPHTYTRTLSLMKQFSKSFKDAKSVIIYKTYPAREEYVVGGDASDLYNKIKLNTKLKKLATTKLELKQAIDYYIDTCNVVLVLGAGDLYDDIKKILKD